VELGTKNQRHLHGQERGKCRRGESVTYSVSTDNSINQVPSQQDSSLGHSANKLNLQSLVPSLLPLLSQRSISALLPEPGTRYQESTRRSRGGQVE
jgi:hypothetical protein